ncbi:MAG: superinfection immunity protein [Myxococcota bacterium]|nr:superinfection immunity protein [Myxococcota bacterium]
MAFALFVGYLVPWIAAVAREHHRHGAVLAATLLLGWTGLGWLAALLYALTSDPQARRPLRLIAGGASGPTPPFGSD